MKNLNLFSNGLRMFAEDNPAGGTPAGSGSGSETKPAGTNGAGGNDGGGDEKKYTDAEVNAIIDKKFAKWKAEQQAEKDEAAKLDKMNGDQKKDYALQQAQQEAADAKATIAKYEMTGTARKAATEAGITVTDADLTHIVTTEAESTQANVEWLKGLAGRIREEVKQEYLSGNAPKINGDKIKGKEDSVGKRIAQLGAASANTESFYFKKN